MGQTLPEEEESGGVIMEKSMEITTPIMGGSAGSGYGNDLLFLYSVGGGGGKKGTVDVARRRS